MWIFFTLLTLISMVMTTVQTFLTVLFRRHARFFDGGLREQAASSHFLPAGFMPLVSILKPVCGLEDGLDENLISFAALSRIRYEVLLSVADPADPAIEVIARVQERFPRAPFRLIIGGDPRLERANRKVARLIAAQPHARGDIIVISDSNVRVEPDDVARTITALEDVRVGCVSNLFTGAGASSFGATIESLHLLSFVVPGSVIAAAAGVPCVVGKSMAIRRDVLRAIGGFEAFSGVLAEDQAIGLAVKKAGYAVALSNIAVRNVVIKRSLRRALDRQVRWNKIRYAFSRGTYTLEFLVNPLPFAILAALAAPHRWLIVAGVALLRILQLAVLNVATAASLRCRQIAVTPVLDLFQFGAQFVPYYDDRVTWRGYRARIGPATALLDIEPAAA